MKTNIETENKRIQWFFSTMTLSKAMSLATTVAKATAITAAEFVACVYVSHTNSTIMAALLGFLFVAADMAAMNRRFQAFIKGGKGKAKKTLPKINVNSDVIKNIAGVTFMIGEVVVITLWALKEGLPVQFVVLIDVLLTIFNIVSAHNNVTAWSDNYVMTWAQCLVHIAAIAICFLGIGAIGVIWLRVVLDVILVVIAGFISYNDIP